MQFVKRHGLSRVKIREVGSIATLSELDQAPWNPGLKKM